MIERLECDAKADAASYLDKVFTTLTGCDDRLSFGSSQTVTAQGHSPIPDLTITCRLLRGSNLQKAMHAMKQRDSMPIFALEVENEYEADLPYKGYHKIENVLLTQQGLDGSHFEEIWLLVFRPLETTDVPMVVAAVPVQPDAPQVAVRPAALTLAIPAYMAVWRRDAGAVVGPNYYLLAPNTVFRLPVDSVLRPESTLYNGIPCLAAAPRSAANHCDHTGEG